MPWHSKKKKYLASRLKKESKRKFLLEMGIFLLFSRLHQLHTDIHSPGDSFFLRSEKQISVHRNLPPPLRMATRLLSRPTMTSHIHGKLIRIPRLHENRTRAGEFANEAFSRTHVTDDTPRSDSFQNVIAVPCDEVAVVDDVFLACTELVTDG